MRHLVFLSLIVSSVFVTSFAVAQDKPTLTGEKPLDGVNVEAVQTYKNPKSQQIFFGLGLWPLDPYYNGLSVDLTYTRYLNKTYSWDVASLDYVYAVDSGLTSELADKYSVQPQSIERLNFVLSSDLNYTFAYGKTIFLTKYIRYFRSSLLAGPGLVITNQESTVGLDMGWRLETFVNDSFSWRVEARYLYAFSSMHNNLAFIFGTAYAY